MRPVDPTRDLLAAWLRAAFLSECPEALREGLSRLASSPDSPGADPEALFERAHAQGIAPLLHASLERWGLPAGQGPFAPFAQAWAATLRQNLLYLEEIGRVTTRFAEEGMETILLKGSALLLSLYEHPALRPMGDVDLLVREADTPRAMAAAESLGYRLLREGRRAELLATNHEIELARTLPDGTRLYLEIHWRLAPREALWRGPGEEPRGIWRDALPSGDPAIPARVPAPEDAIVLAALHLGRHVFSRALWLCDVSLLASSPELLWEDVITKAGERDATFALWATLEGARALCGAEVPGAVLAATRPGRVRSAAIGACLDREGHFGAGAALAEESLPPIRRYGLKVLLHRDTFAAFGSVLGVLFPSDAWLRARYAPGRDVPTATLRLGHLATAFRLALRSRTPASPPRKSVSCASARPAAGARL